MNASDGHAASPSRGTAAVLLAASSLTVMAGATIAPALPSMAQHFAAADPEHGERAAFLVRLALTGPGLLTAIVSLAAGPLIDRVGRVPPLLAGLVLYIAAGTSGLYVQTITQLLVGRALLGVAVALVMVATTALIGDLYQGPRRQKFNGLQGACMSFGGVLFLVAAGFLADTGWRSPFVIYFAAAGVLLAALMLAANLRAATNAAGSSPQPEQTVSPGAIGRILILGFVGMVLFYMIPTHLPFRLDEIGITERKYGGIAIAASGLVAGVIAASYSIARARLSFLAIVAVQMGLMAASFAIIAKAESYPLILLGAVVNGLGQGFMIPNLTTWVQSESPVHLRGRNIGWLVSAVFLGQFLSPIITKPLGDRFGIAGEFGIASGFMILIAIFAALASKFGSRGKPVA